MLYKPNTEREEGGVLLRPSNLTKGYLLGIAYAATLGGCGSLLGTPTNLAFKGIFETYFPNEPEIVSLKFFLYSAPIALLNTLLTWLWLQFVLMGLLRPKSNDALALLVTEEVAIAIKGNITQKYIEMGGWNAKEFQVAVVAVLFHLVLLARPFWAVVLPQSVIKDASPTILFIILLFIIISQCDCFECCPKNAGESKKADLSLYLIELHF